MELALSSQFGGFLDCWRQLDEIVTRDMPSWQSLLSTIGSRDDLEVRWRLCRPDGRGETGLGEGEGGRDDVVVLDPWIGSESERVARLGVLVVEGDGREEFGSVGEKWSRRVDLAFVTEGEGVERDLVTYNLVLDGFDEEGVHRDEGEEGGSFRREADHLLDCGQGDQARVRAQLILDAEECWTGESEEPEGEDTL
jgi:hypothetical protein